MISESELTLTYILAVHNESAVLTHTVRVLSERLRAFRSAEIMLVENGSVDDSWELAQRLSGSFGTVRVTAIRESGKGIGYAHDRGMREAFARLQGDRTRHWFVLNAADLPFDFSDLDQLAPKLASEPQLKAFIGSKAHPQSVIHAPAKRRVMSHAYRWARAAVLGMRTGDSQGSIFMRADHLGLFYDRIESRDFFHTTEVVYFSEKYGVVPEELPVRLRAERRASTVKPLRDGTKMLAKLLQLRLREGRIGGT